MIQILVGVFVGEDHRDQGDGRNATMYRPGDGRTGQAIRTVAMNEAVPPKMALAD